MADITIFNNELEEAIRTECSAARLRLDPNANVAEMHAALAARGVKLALSENGLVVEGTSTGISARDAIISASKDEALKQNFVLAGGRVTHLNQLSKNPSERARQAVAFQKEHGEAGWNQLVLDSRLPEMRPDVVISASMNCADWMNLRRSEKVKAIAAWGSGADKIVSAITARKK
jgi:hypothetical protein